jgi:3-phenylpropionate/trans-cinnamate dioxygenase ferredoxin reductase subunit
MSDSRTFVIVGAGQAGRWVALTLRASGYAGRIVWFGAEVHAPYDRPPLSKAVLKGDVKGDVTQPRLALIAPDKFAELGTDWRPGQRVVAIDRAAREVRTERGEHVGYDALFLAYGGQARTLPGLAPHPRVLTLRTWEDAQALKAAITAARHVLVLGGGWIGLEVAASSRALGREVTVLEATPRLCIRTVPPGVSAHLLALHRGQGVDVRLGDGVLSVSADDHRVRVSLASGAALEGDLLVVGIGLVANESLAAEAGLSCANGILTDADGRTSDPHVFAVGDVANALRGDGQRARIESWENAQRQAVAAAKAALGIEHDIDAEGPPWFWSDQYEDNLQLLGTPGEGMRVIERHAPEKRQRLWFYCEGPRVCALAAVNGGREVKIVRKWMRERRFPADLDVLGVPGTDINKLPLATPAAPEEKRA